MNEPKRLTSRNEQIAAMLADGEQLKNFYRFIAQNPHINLHDACQIIIERPNATVCFSFSEWAAMDRRVTKGRKGIAYYDNDGYKQFVFDANDTHGDNRYSRPILPMKCLLGGLDELNGTDIKSDDRNDYRKIRKGVQLYLQEQGELSGDELSNKLLVDGIAFSLYAKTGFPKSAGVNLSGLPFSYTENAAFVKDVYVRTDMLVQDIEEAYSENKQDVQIIDDTEEVAVTDEPIILDRTDAVERVHIDESKGTYFRNYLILVKHQYVGDSLAGVKLYLGKTGNFDENSSLYDNTDGSLLYVSDNANFGLLFWESGFYLSQQELIDNGTFTADDYKKFAELKSGILANVETDGEVLFAVDDSDADSGLPFRYPNWQVEQTVIQTEAAEEKSTHPLNPIYKRYMDAQILNPQSIVFIRLGDFYEVLGEGAKTAAQELNLTLTSREVGLPERVVMCGLPYHAMDRYLDKILENHGVVMLELNQEPVYIQSHTEALEQSAEVQEEKANVVIAEKPEAKLAPIDDELSETDDWRNELAEELEELDEQNDETDEPAEQVKQTEQPKDGVKSKAKKEEKGIKDRKRKENPQLSMFDLFIPQEKSAEEALIERQLKYGSGVEHGKFRIFDKYNENPTLKTFADFLKNEYGWGGHGSWDGDDEMHDAKGITMSVRGKKGEYLVQVSLKWPEVATRIADLIDDDNYLSEQEKIMYVDYKAEQNRLREQRLEQERRRDKFFEKILTDEPRERKDRIAEAYHNAENTDEFISFVKQEYGTHTTKELDGQSIVINDYGVFVSENGDSSDMSSRYSVSWVALEKKLAALINANSYIAPITQDADQPDIDAEEDWDALIDAREIKSAELSPEQQKIKDIVDRIVKEGTENTSEGNWVVYFDEFGDDEQFVREHQDEIADMLASREEVAEIDIADDGFDTTYYLDYCPNYEDTWHEFDDEEKSENTDLNGVLDQSELGGAKTRFKGNVAAIKLVNKLYAENRDPTDAEKKVLSQFVGWGGLSQAFDENNPQWAKEYAELKALLSTDDYEQAKSSTLNAYYTAKDVIGGIYAALDRFGVKGNNRILEPAMGTGNFLGFMPKEIADGSRLYGVELDNLTGRIAAKLYPQANVQIKGFEDTSFPDDKFNIVVGNVPFGGYGVADSAYNRYNFKVHDYFLAKSIDKVKPNGIVAIVTSKGTMDKLNPSARKYVAERAELVGAIRLPETAFKQTAGTEAVADILFFRKRVERINVDTENIEWLGTGKTEEGYEINNYYIKHPEMVLGTLAEETGLYGGNDVTVKLDDRELSVALNEAVKNLPQGFYTVPEKMPIEEETEVDYNVKPMCYKADSGRLYMRVGDEMVEQSIPAFPKDAYQRLQGMIALREELHRILDIQIRGCSDAQLVSEQTRLNTMYDKFVQKYGELNSQTNVRLFKDDGDAALLFACENINKETKKVSKAEVFYKRTIQPYIVPTNTDDCFEALQISKNERGKADIAYIEELTGKDYDTVLFELGDMVFRNPKTAMPDDKYSGFETAEEYLSGRVVEKLNEAEYYAESNPEYRRNVEALKQVQPTPLKASEISARLGATWIDKDIYKEFYCDLVGVYWWKRGDVELFYNPFDSSWRLDQKESIRYDTQMKQKEVYGTKRAPAYRLFIDAMNLRATTIYDTVIDSDGKERRVLNQPETIAAREKQNQIKELFANWIYKKPERREELEATYNRLFNQIRLPSYDGSYLKFPEMNPAIVLNPHQKNAVHRIITSPDSTLLHHVVGSGKTFTMVASIMKMRQLGICKKVMVAVPNHLVEQWAGEWRKLYPNAKILVATKEDLDKDNRQRFVSKVALGDWDGIIIAQSSFAKIPISQERQIKKLKQEIKLIEETVHKQWEENGMPRGAVKNLERIKKSREAMLKKLMDGNKKDDILTFENLGVDYLYIDEAHYYKNLFLFTKMNNVAGVSNAASQRASDVKLKCEYLQELHRSDRGLVFGTGTPISNSMSEMYTMQSYLQPSALRGSGIEFFDGWAANFGETITSMELSPSGQGYRARTRFAKFTNLPELLTMYRSFADVQTADMVKLNVPEAERHVINLKPSDTIVELAQQIAERADKIHDRLVSPEEDNMLKITSDGKKLALDPRCFVRDSEDESGSKLNEAVQRIYEIWKDSAEKKGTQIVFCDLSTPKKRFEDYECGTDFDAYNDLKYKLVQKGIPKDEIAFIHDANTDEQKQTLFDNVNSGTVRVLIGSTEKCGAGTNVQKRLVALHHLDTPYRPSDMEQREGRIIRQGNENKKVDIYTYVTERTFDSYSYQILENKQKFISQINKGDLTVREAEDIDETTLSYAEIKAITAANPKIKRKMEVDAEISRLRVLEGQYKKNLYELQDKILKYFPEEIRKQELLIERVTLDTMHLQASKSENPDAFEISVNGKVYTDRKEGGKALTEALYKSKPETVVAEYCGFKISINPIVLIGAERDITLSAQGQYTVQIGESATGNLQRIDNFIEDLPKRKERLQNRLQQIKDDLQTAKEQVEKPFEHNEQLLELLNEQTVLNAELDLDKKDDVIVADDGEYDDNYRALPTQRRSDKEDDIIDKEDKIALMQVNAIRLEKANSPDFEEAVINSVLLEFDEYKKELEKQSVQDVFDNSYKTHIYERLTNVVECGREIFEDNVYRALYEDKGHILESLYDAFIDNYGYYSLDENEEAALMIEEYCKDNYNEIYCPTTYYGKDTENRAYYRFTQNITAQNIGKVKESKAEMYTIAAPSCSLSQEELERNHIFYLNIGRDIEEEALADDDKAMSNMMHAMDNYKRIYPLYLQTGEYAHDHYEIIAHRNSRKSNIECKLAIEDAIRNNFDGMYLNEGIEDKIIGQYGMERVAFVVANTVNEHSWDGRFSRENKEWAKTVPMSEDENVRRECCLNTHPAVLDSFVDRVRKKIKENKENQELDQNAVNAAVKDGENKKWISFRVSSEAALKRYQLNTRFKMPKGSGYEGCAYSIFNDRIRESKMLVNLDSDGRELAYEIRLPEDYKIELYEGGEKIIDLRAWELAKMVDGTTSDKYEREARVNIRLPREAVIKDYDASVLVAAPTDSEYKRYVYYLPSSVVKEDTEKDNGSLIANVGENFKITLRKGEEKIELTAKQFAEAVSGKTDYKREPTALDEYREQQSDDDKTWRTVHISENAVIAHYQNSTLFKMPKGEYAGLVYYLPSGMVRKNENGLSLRIPEDFVAHLKDGDEKKDLSSQELIAAIEGKTDADYESVYRAPSEEVKEQFAQVERNLRANVPEEMRCKPNWVVVRTRKNNDTGRLDKFLINPHTGKFAESDNPETWSDFDTACKYAKENGGICLAYALDGKDGIACVDLDGCVTENGYTEIANRVLDVCGKTYIETSVSGKGLHIFGKTKGADLRSFSKDKTMEYYQGGHFIAMTGDGARFSRLESFDTPVMQAVLESKLEKRTEWKNTGMGVEGLSSMGDREMLDRAFAAKNGDTVRMLYNGEDVRGNHSNSDMSLMNYLAFWSNHDIDQMLRVFSTSGLYRPDKPQSYYEHTAIKAVKGTPVYTPPKSSDNAPKSSGGNGKR